MPESIKKTIPWFLILTLTFLTATLGFNMELPFRSSRVKADDITSEVAVGNTAPSFTVSPTDNSSSTSPTNASTTLTFNATATDANSEQYYLAICKTTNVTPVNGDAPTCDDGNWCISSAIDSGSPASCSTSTEDTWSESNNWYGFACDGNASDAKCSSVDTGDMPFKVNRPPVFTAVTSNPAADPGSNATWYSSSSDPDSDDSQDQVKLIVCDTQGFTTSTDSCTGSELCASSFTNSDASCSYAIPTPTDDDASPYDAYVYVVDTHGFEASSTSYESNAQYTVNNVSPTVTNVRLNNENNINLTDSASFSVDIAGLLADNNTCDDISSATSSTYTTDVGYSGCTSQNDNNCYYNISCGTLESCGGASDTDRYATCTVSLWYHANPTIADTPWDSYHWEAYIQPQDDNGAFGQATSSATVEVNDLLGINVTTTGSNLAFGTISPGSDTGTLYVTSTVIATGNIALDTDLSGEGLEKAGGQMIDIQNQEYSTSTYASYGAGADLTTSTAEFELELAKTTDHAATSVDNIYWGLAIPSGTPTGTYQGTTTVAAVQDELSWP